ncbi:ATP-binding protein [Chitinilyticum piscinae]|uniref:histidine kinase n=1 Tax=Chitinilyticum piscinae TaxID=2866724 RepID=A0A8J7FJI8_9NEIS|nr:ATP-binding protein [Chitinilyticum piscinae]MBE9607979.1 tetratricopeptide repeat protein [Chitinilyticum piscinae]
MPIPVSPLTAEMLARIAAIPADRQNDARELCEIAFEQARERRDYSGFVAIAELYGHIMDNLGKAVLARDRMYEALQIAQSLHLFSAEAHLLESIGRSYYVQGDYHSALQFWARCIEVATLAQEWVTQIMAYIGLGMIHDALKDPATAVQIHRNALQRMHEHGLQDPYLEAKARINLGQNLRQTGDFAGAVQEYERARELCLANQLTEFATETAFRLAEVLLMQQQGDAARPLLTQALAIAEQAGYSWTRINVLRLQGLLEMQQQRPAQGLPLLQQAIALAHDIANEHLEAAVLLDAAECAAAAGSLTQALDYYRQGHQLELSIVREAAPQRMGELENWAGLHPNTSQLLLELSNSPSIDTGELDAAFAAICATGCQVMDVQRCGIWLYDADAGTLGCSYLCRGGLPAELPRSRIDARECPAVFEWLARGGPLVAHDARHHQLTWELHARYLAPNHVFSLLGFPLRVERRVVAVLLCEASGAQRNWSPIEVARGGQLADIAARALINHERQLDQQNIQQLNTELTSANEALEARVAARTAELEQAMTQLVQTEKMAALGSLVAGVAHELNTPLGISLTTATTFGEEARTLQQKVQAGAIKRSELDTFLVQTSEAARLIEHNCWRAAEMIANFKQVAVDTASDLRRHFNLATTVNEVLFALKPRYKHTPYRIETELPEDLEFDSYPGALEQVLGNLVLNAIMHGFDGRPDGVIRITATRSSKQQVQLAVEDNGRGIPAELHKRVFEPFFTTKFGQGGSGLGLYLVYTLVCGRLAGQIELVSAPDHGARFIMTLPVIHPDASV